MTEAITQAAGNTPTTGSTQTGATTAAAAGTTGTAAPAAAPASAAAPVAAPQTQQATEGQTAAGTTPAAGAEGDKGAATAAPAKYEFKAPNGSVLDDTVMAEFSTVAKELGLSQEAAQKVVDKLGPTIAGQNAKAISAAMNTATEQWAEQTRSDKDIGGDKLAENLGIAKKALERFGSPELSALLGRFDPKTNPNGTGLGNHPALIKLLHGIGKAISEDKFVPGGTKPVENGQRGSTASSAAKSLYPNQS